MKPALDDADRWVHVLVTETLADDAVAAVVARFDAAIAADVAALTVDRELRRDLHASNVAQARALLGWIVSDSDDVTPPPAAHELARTVARRGLPLKVLMQIYRAGQTVLVRHVAEVAAERVQDPNLVPGIQIRLLERAGRWISVSLEILTDTYAEQRERDLRGDVARRVETVRDLLSGELDDAEVASRRLRHSIGAEHVAFVLWTDGTEPVDLHAVARRLVPPDDERGLLTTPAGSRALWGWVSGHSPEVRDAPSSPGSVRLAVGEPGVGTDGFRRSHLEAIAAQSVSETTGANSTVRYRDVEITYLLRGHRDAAAVFAARHLAGVDGDDPAAVRVRRTLSAYLRHDRSLDAAARELGVHRNTVRYRVQRAESLLGHPVGGPNRLAVELALLVRDGAPPKTT